MPPEQPDKQSAPSNQHHGSPSTEMTPSDDVTVISDTSEPETSSSRKHDRQGEDRHGESPSKRQKSNGDSESPMRKDTIMTPKPKPKKSRGKINNHKASRTSNHQELKERVKTLELEASTRQQAQERLQQNCNKQAEQVQAQKQMIETERQENQRRKCELEDLTNQAEAFERSCQNKDEKLKVKEGAIAAKQTELDDSKSHSVRLNISLNEKEVTLQEKDAVIANLQKRLHDRECHVASLEQSLAKLKGNNDVITALKEKLGDSENQSARLEASLREKEHELQIAKRNQSDWRNELASSAEKLTTMERALSEANEERDKARDEADALHLINDANGHRIYNIKSREKRAKNEENKAKEALKSAETDHQKKASKLEARRAQLQTSLNDLESQKNDMVANLQRKVKESLQQGQRYNYEQPDEKTKADFANLESTIRQFVDKYARPVFDAPEQELETVWPNWSPNLRNFLASPLLCTQVFEAYVWECLVARIFAPESAIWAGELGRSLEKTLKMAADETVHADFRSGLYTDFQYLRSSSSSLIGRLNGANFLPKYFDSDVGTMVTKLAELTRRHGTHEEMNEDAMEIFKVARDFEIQLRMLKATHTIRMYKAISRTETSKYGFDFADEDMDDCSPNRSGKTVERARSVDFIVRPGLYKRGNNSGANYETKTCLIKMGVVCNTAELLHKSGSSTPARLSSANDHEAPRSGGIKQETGSSTSRRKSCSKANDAKKGSSKSNPLLIKAEETDSPQDPDPLSTPGLTSGPPSLKSHDTAHMQSGMATNVKTRSQSSPKSDSDVHVGKSLTKSTGEHLYPTGPATGRGGGSSAKNTRTHRRSDSDPEWEP